MKDIQNIEDIKIFVNAFYGKIREDKLLAPIFASRIESEQWPQHLNKMYRFWDSVLFFQKTYKGNPFARHIGLPVETAHFQQWVNLFTQTIDEHFAGEKAEDAKRRSRNMANMFSAKIHHLSNNPNFKPIV